MWVMLSDTVSCSNPASECKASNIAFPPSAGCLKPTSATAKINTPNLSVLQINILSYISNMCFTQILTWALPITILSLWWGNCFIFILFYVLHLPSLALLCTPVTNPFRSIKLRPCNGIWNNDGLRPWSCVKSGNTFIFFS